MTEHNHIIGMSNVLNVQAVIPDTIQQAIDWMDKGKTPTARTLLLELLEAIKYEATR